MDQLKVVTKKFDLLSFPLSSGNSHKLGDKQQTNTQQQPPQQAQQPPQQQQPRQPKSKSQQQQQQPQGNNNNNINRNNNNNNGSGMKDGAGKPIIINDKYKLFDDDDYEHADQIIIKPKNVVNSDNKETKQGKSTSKQQINNNNKNNNNNSKTMESPIFNNSSNSNNILKISVPDESKYDGTFKGSFDFKMDPIQDYDDFDDNSILMDEMDDFVQIEEKHLNPICSQFYIKFYQTPEMCSNETIKWLNQQWFLPSDYFKKIVWGNQNRFYYPVYVFNVTTSTSFRASFTLNEVVETTSETISNNHKEIIVCASTSIDSKLVDLLIQNHSYSHRLPYYLPSEDEMERFNSTTDLNEKILGVDIPKSNVLEKVKSIVAKIEIDTCKKYVKRKFNVKKINLDLTPERDITINQESYSIVYLPISSTTYQYGDAFYDTLTSGNKGKTVGTYPLGTGSVGGAIIGTISKVSNLVNDSIGMI